MGVCCIIGCKNRRTNKKEGVSMHRIPVKKRNEWLKILDGIKKNTGYICSDHFAKDCLVQNVNRRELHEHAIPSIFLCCPKEKLLKRLSVPTGNLPSSSQYLKLFENIPGPNSSNAKDPCSTETDSNTQHGSEVASCSSDRAKSMKRSRTISRTTCSPHRKATCTISPKTQSSLVNESQYMEKRYSNKERKLQQNKRRNVKIIADLQTVLRNLKSQNLLSSQQIFDLKNFSGSSWEIIKHQIGKQSHSQYSAELRKFALTLHYYSTSAYNYVRQSLDFCLPHPKTISQWYNSDNGEPGFTSEAFKAISLRAQHSDYSLVGSLSLEEMPIRKSVEFDGSKYHGFVEYGIHNDDDSSSQASHVLVFMVVCINGSWKIPVGYFFVTSTNSEQRASLVKLCLKMCHEANIKIISVTFDGDASNMAMIQELGCNLNCNKTWFSHPESQDNVYAYPDPCDMIKNVRNAFEDKKIFLDENNRQIEWKYIEQMEKLQNSEELHLENKHTRYDKAIMKVRLATQLLSESVACSLEYNRDHLLLSNFKNCEATVDFIRNFNILFDILNSKNIYQAGFKRPISENNCKEIFDKLDSIELYIRNLKLVDKTPLIVSKRKMGFIGLITCMLSLKYMFADLTTTSSLLKYVPTYKLNKDHLELFFGTIRGHGANNNNPTARQFREAYKKTLVHMELQSTSNGNCIPLEQIYILHCTGTKNKTNSLDIINMSTLNYQTINKNKINPDIDHSYCIGSKVISEYSNSIIAYIACFVVRYLQQNLLCDTCVSSLEISSNDYQLYSSYYALIDSKTKRSHLYPSNDVIHVCRSTEKLIRRALAESGGIFLKKKYSILYIVSSVLKFYSENNFLFKDLECHMWDNNILENHITLLIRAIAEKYANIRLHYILKKKC